MLHVLTHNILPVFFILALGFAMGRAGTIQQSEARVINRVAFLVLQAPLIFMLLTGLDLSTIRFDALALYVATEVVCLLITYVFARHICGCAADEAFLLGMCVTFVNSLLYVLPIATLIYGEAGALPIAAIVAFEASVAFSFYIIGMELIAGKEGIAATLPRLARNPVLITIALSLALNLAQVPIPEPIMTAARFAGVATAPMTLFAMGVVLSSHSLKPDLVVTGIAFMKLVAFPALLWLGFLVASPQNPWQSLFLLCAAGPSGAMAFSLALLYEVRTDRIAPIIIWTSILSLVSLAWLA